MIPTVALVGKPNTGKSTLFNRLVGSKSAITFDEAGTTRDRVFGRAVINDMPIILVDTGGLELNEGDEVGTLDSDIQKQTQIGIEEADLIVFLVDSSHELTSSDFRAAEILRKSSKPVIIVSSKVDKSNSSENVYNVYELGFGDSVKISAVHNEGIDELNSKLVSELKKNGFKVDKEDKVKTDSVSLCFVGKPNVGKSSLFNALFGKDQVIVSDMPGTTLDSIAMPFKFEDNDFVLVDTAGIRKSGKRRGEWLEKYSFLRSLRAIESSDVAVLVLDAKEGLTKQDMRVAQFVLEAKKGLIIDVNKSDLVKPEEKNRLLGYLSHKMAFAHFAPVIFNSAKTGTNVLEILVQARLIAEERKKKVKTNDLNYFFERIVGKHSPPFGIKFKFIDQVDVSPPKFNVFCNKPDSVHFSYRRFIENEIRKEFGFNGTAVEFVYKRS